MSLGWLVDSYRTTLLDPAKDAEIFSELVQNLKKGSFTKALFSGTGLKPDFQYVIEKGLLLRFSLHEPFLFFMKCPLPGFEGENFKTNTNMCQKSHCFSRELFLKSFFKNLT
jgi:hypothetical protein